jgi:squalene-associated FAD-dependent desaturase
MTRARAGSLRVAVVGGGWAGLSAAVRARQNGHRLTLIEMAPQLGGRARSTIDGDLDNGQHILIGAYRETLALMQAVGVDLDQVLLRRRLVLCHADGRGLALPPGPAAPAFAWAVVRCSAWRWRERMALLAQCARWAAAGFDCQPDRTVAELCGALPPAVRALLVDPLCVAALNTPATEASARVFLRVLRDGLFGGRGGCDLLLPRQPLHRLLPQPAGVWLRRQGVDVRTGHRVMALQRGDGGWQLDGQVYDAVVLACSASEAARLVRPLDPAWAATAAALSFEPIVTVYLQCPGVSLPHAMLALNEDARSPAQFVFDHGALGGKPGRFAFVISGAAPWVETGLEATVQAVVDQARRELTALGWSSDRVGVEHAVAERRATFRCTPALSRPPMALAPGLWVVGDYVAGPYPATLEGAVRSGLAAANALGPVAH